MDSGNRSSIKIIKSNFIISICFFYTLTIYIFDAFLADNMFKFMGNTSLMLPIKLLGLVLSFICATLYTPKISRLELFILFILFIYVSSVFLGTSDAYEAFYFWSNYIGYFAIYLVTKIYLEKYGYYKLTKSITFISFLVFLLSIYVDFGAYGRAAFRSEVGGTYICSQLSVRKCGISSNPNILATMLLPIIFEYCYMLYNRLHTKTTLFVFFLCLLLLVLTGSKTVLFLSLLFLCVTFTKISLLRQKSTFVILVSFSVLFLLIATIFGDYFYEIISSRFLSGNALDSSGRYEIYLGIFVMLNQNIIFGTGLDLREDYSQYFPGWLRLSDSVYGNILVSSGMFGFLIFTLTMFCFLATVIKKDRVRFLFLLVLSIGFLFEDYLLRGFSFMFIMSVTFYLISTNFKFGNTK